MKRIMFLLGCSVFAIDCISQDAAQLNNTLPVSSIAAVSATVPEVQINPNPVSGGSFQLEMQHLQQGKYNIYLFDEKGKKYLVKTLVLDNASFSGALQLPRKAGKGIYILQVIGANTNARVSKKMIIE